MLRVHDIYYSWTYGLQVKSVIYDDWDYFNRQTS